MRLSSFAAAAILAAPATLAARLSTTATPAGPRVGILAGLSSATISGNDISLSLQDAGFDKKRRNGVVAGVYAALPLARLPLSIRPELL